MNLNIMMHIIIKMKWKKKINKKKTIIQKTYKLYYKKIKIIMKEKKLRRKREKTKRNQHEKRRLKKHLYMIIHPNQNQKDLLLDQTPGKKF